MQGRGRSEAAGQKYPAGHLPPVALREFTTGHKQLVSLIPETLRRHITINRTFTNKKTIMDIYNLLHRKYSSMQQIELNCKFARISIKNSYHKLYFGIS